jgi:deoxyribodipyrimidine photolyase-related protein
MTLAVWILGDQLNLENSALDGLPAGTPVLMIESIAHVRVRNYHQQKLVLVWSAMRHFAERLREQGYQVHYVEQAEDFEQTLTSFIKKNRISELKVMEPADIPFQELLQNLNLACKLTITLNNHYLWSAQEFCQWAKGRKRLLMEDFYRETRRRLDILMDEGKPVGGQWNYDQDNRKPPKKGLNLPEPLSFKPDAITQSVIERVKKNFGQNFGQVNSFNWAVTQEDALKVLEEFIQHRLAQFGPYQDAMITGQWTMFHGLISPYLNLGILSPKEVIQRIEKAYRSQELPLASVEGFIRQVIGWREYIRGLYLLKMPEGYARKNWFDHQQPLPDFFWTGETSMNCLKETLEQTIETGYAHHIQRLMILGNFSLIAGLNPQAVENWFHSAYIDAYDWVMQTNVLGMALFADGGVLASKPYAASANYINKMSNYCEGCRYNPKERLGKDACPFNYLYWTFLDRHREKLNQQGRMGLVLAHLDKLDEKTRAAYASQSTHFLAAQSKG